MNSDTVTGFINHIIYQNPENGYTVLELMGGGDTVTVTGNLGRVSEGESLICRGYFTTHPVYGEQFRCESYEVTEPEDLESIERYLGSGAIKGIGPSLAARIVKEFGDDTLRVLDEEPELLSRVRGISANGAREIAMQVSEKRELRSAMIYLQKFGISLALSVKIYEEYGNDVYNILKTNPYALADDITGVGFHIADDIAKRIGFSADSDFRIRSGIYYALVGAVSDGHVYLPEMELYERAAELLGCEPERFSDALTELVIDKKIVKAERDGEDVIYAAPYYYMELYTAKKLADLNVTYSLDEEKIDRVMSPLIDDEDFEQDEDQRSAVCCAVSHGVTVITGGPGTGKTTTINAIIRVFEEEGLQVALAAPTGRAAKRMTEATGYEAKTIHRLLEFQGGDDADTSSVRFMRNEQNPLDADVIIIDETSMVDIFLMHSLLRAVPYGARLILVGDASQLPSVGAGNVLCDIIDSGCFGVVSLKRIFRQSDAGDIIKNAHKIDAGEPVDTEKKSDDFLFIKRYDSGRILGSIITLVKEKLPDYVHSSRMEIQVLTPMRKGALGVNNLNRVLQEALNPPLPNKREKELSQGIFREGDKVMQIKNNYKIEWTMRSPKGFVIQEGTGIFNGDIGVIKSINLFSEEIVVSFDEGKEVVYPFKGAEELELAYALTVHKSQGSEYPAVVLPLLSGPRPLMNRNLLYTAVTRAKSCVCIVGSPECFLEMAANDEEQRRYSGLAECIRETEA